VASRVLSGDPRLNVREATRERVAAAARELSYRPNRVARGLRVARTDAYGLLIPDFANPIYASIIAGAEEAADRDGAVLVVASLAGGEAAARRAVELAGSGRVDGLLIAGQLAPAEEVIAEASRAGVPWLLVNRRAPRPDRSVSLDDEAGARLAVAHLLELGHARIGHLGGPAHADTAGRRRQGYEDALATARIPVDERLVESGAYDAAAGETATAALLAQRPTAVFAASALAAIGALHAIAAAGLSVPGDVSVIAMHDLPLADHLQPPLTTVRLPREAMAQRAIELLRTTAPDETVSEVLRGPIELVRRASTGPPAR
jgi:LacI family transcriptional regulator